MRARIGRLAASLSPQERHRHRYEVNIKYVKQMEAAGLQFVGRDTTGERMEVRHARARALAVCQAPPLAHPHPAGARGRQVFELDDHPYYLGCQFHPEFKSRPTKPSPLFLGLLHAAAGLPPL